MKPGIRGSRGIQKILARSRQLLNPRDSVTKYLAIDKFISNFETTYLKVTGRTIRVMYRKGYYYFDHTKWSHNDLNKELERLLREEQNSTS